MTAEAMTCEIHPDAPTVTTQHWTRCRGCDSARKVAWARKRRLALPAGQADAARAARRDRDAWQQVYAAYTALCDRQGIPTTVRNTT